MSNVIDLHRIKLANILKMIKKQEDLIKKAKQSPLVS